MTLNIYNVSGQLVSTLVRETLNAGVHRVNFDASGFSSGVYFYRLDRIRKPNQEDALAALILHSHKPKKPALPPDRLLTIQAPSKWVTVKSSLNFYSKGVIEGYPQW